MIPKTIKDTCHANEKGHKECLKKKITTKQDHA